jgi:nitrilase
MAATSLIRLGTASPSSLSTTTETLGQLSALARRAATNKVDILLLPEAYLGGYPRGTAFGCVVGGRSDEGRDEYLAYFRGAVDLGDIVGDGGAGGGDAWVRREIGGRREGKEDEERRGDGTREELERIARDTGVFLVVGVIERAGGSLYCAAVYVCPALGVIGKRRKVMPVRLTTRFVTMHTGPRDLMTLGRRLQNGSSGHKDHLRP